MRLLLVPVIKWLAAGSALVLWATACGSSTQQIDPASNDAIEPTSTAGATVVVLNQGGSMEGHTPRRSRGWVSRTQLTVRREIDWLRVRWWASTRRPSGSGHRPKNGEGMAASSITERFVLRHGDITTVSVDAIVNAANSSLTGGGGVDGAIHRAGGRTILGECQAWVVANGPLATGEAMLTTAGDLPAAHVIHTVGPVWGLDSPARSDELLASAYRSSLSVAASHGIESIAFPNISTGIFGFPKARAAEVAITTVRVELAVLPSIECVTFVCHDAENHNLYEQLLLREI